MLGIGDFWLEVKTVLVNVDLVSPDYKLGPDHANLRPEQPSEQDQNEEHHGEG